MITLIPKPCKDSTMTKKTKKQKNYRSISLINIETKILNRILLNPAIYKKNIIAWKHRIHSGMQGWFTIQKSISIMHYVQSRRNTWLSQCRKAFDKIQLLLLIKILSKSGIEGHSLQLMKGMYTNLQLTAY